MPESIPLVGGGARLVRWAPSLVDGLSAAFAEAEEDLRAWMPFAAAEQEDAERFVAWCSDAFDEGRSFAYAIVVDEVVGGYVNVTPSGDGSASVGYWIRPSARGRGLASSAVRAIADEAFSALSVDRVTADVDEANLASRRVLERAGFSVGGSHARPPSTSTQSEVELVYVRHGVRSPRPPHRGPPQVPPRGSGPSTVQ